MNKLAKKNQIYLVCSVYPVDFVRLLAIACPFSVRRAKSAPSARGLPTAPQTSGFGSVGAPFGARHPLVVDHNLYEFIEE